MTESGIVILVNDVQFSNAYCPIRVRLFDSTIFVNDVQSENVLIVIPVTEFGSVILLNDVQRYETNSTKW